MLDIFLVQMESTSSKDCCCKQKNFDTVRNLLQGVQISPSDDSLIILPEMFATGYIPQTPFDFAEEFSGGAPKGETVDFLRNLANERKCHVLGAGIQISSRDRKFTNHSALFAPNKVDEISGYDKAHLFFPEQKDFSAGESISLFKIGDWTIASGICYDLRFPELFREAVKKGANLITIQAAWPLIRKDHWEILLKARAIENQVYIAAVNGVSPSEKQESRKLAGTSMIIDPKGNVIACGNDGEEAVIHGKIDLEPLLEYRKVFPVLDGIVQLE